MTGIASPSAFVNALLPDLVLGTCTLLLLLNAVATPHKAVLGRAEGAERTTRVTRLALALTIFVGALVVMQWVNNVPGTTDQRIAGDGFRWAIDLIAIAGTACTLMLIDAEQKK